MATNNAIALTAAGLVGYDGAGTFNATTITQSNVVIGGGSTSTYAGVAPPANIGTPLISNGIAGTAPAFGTAQVRGGGTGLATLTANELMASGTTSTGNMQQIAAGTAGQILVSNGGSLPSFQTPANVFAWTDEGTSFSPAAGNGYFVTAAATATLPASPSEGQTITIYADTGSTVVVQAQTGQVIRIAASTSSSGGTASSSVQGNSVTLVYRSASTTWNSPASQGTWVLA